MTRFFKDKQINFSGWLLLLLSGIILFIFSLPHVMALRKLLLLIAFLFACKSFWEGFQKPPKPLLHAVMLFVILQVWMLIIAVFISDQPSLSLSEWKGQWLPVLMCLIIGIGLARILMQSKLNNPRAAVLMTILIPIAIFLCINASVIIYYMILAGKFLPNQLGITDQKGITNYLIALVEPILIVDMLARLTKGNRLLPVPSWVISALLVLALFSLFTASSRNGILIMLFAFALGAGMMIAEIRKTDSPQKIIFSVLATLILILAIAFTSYKVDSRWQTFIETVPIAWDIDHDLLWLNGDGRGAPLTSSGRAVEVSEYSRIAWAHEGWRMLLSHPWGTEISRDTFHKLELEKYGHAGMSHSHNSWLDLGLQVGIPGLLVWGCMLWILAQFGWQSWRAHKEPLGLVLTILVIMFAVRGLLDSIFRDHEIEQFMLVAGLLFGVLSFEKTNFPQNERQQ